MSLAPIHRALRHSSHKLWQGPSLTLCLMSLVAQAKFLVCPSLNLFQWQPGGDEREELKDAVCVRGAGNATCCSAWCRFEVTLCGLQDA